ncbi:MAG: TlpA family protein disulfide reductase [Gammaproteobacteria bacterium]|nr:TlpA family protein disulfide reductase [Gammaproteobacteria bacterium]MBU1654589.1 TlpA family protein disulfide reductase [Gammaproteobacteria bacterium]MBU1962317.1 TlpA family protein disulfide reductase [Gammaproteobacteria bacterium]
MAAILGMAAPFAQAAVVDFELPDLEGKARKLSDYRGKWVVVNYWATWCPPCLEEMPELELFHNNHKDKDAVVLGVNLEQISPNALRDFVDGQFISYPVLLSGPKASTELGRVPGMPTSFLIAPDGKIVARQVGTVTAADLEGFIEAHKN